MSVLKFKDANSSWVTVPVGGVGVPSGGTQGQVLMKSSATDYATGWGNINTFESGTDGIWTYRKYSDGTYHAWYEGGINLLTGTAWAGGYFHQSSSSLSPPAFSTAVTSLAGSPNSATLGMFCGHATDYSTYWFNDMSSTFNNF